MKRLGYRYQRTLARPVEIVGLGYLTGKEIRLRFRPAPAHAGVVFVRTDLKPPASIPACLEQVTGTNRRTTLGHPPLCVGMVEHVLAALAGLHIDNCFVELDGPEPPGLDGSARAFVNLLCQVGSRLQPARRSLYTVERPVILQHKDASLALHPSADKNLKVSYLLNYGPWSPIDRQMHTVVVTPESFRNDLACCRTFLLEEEAQAFKKQGYGSRTQVTDLVIFGADGPLGQKLRFANEPARHKILDIVGDLALLGHDLCGHVVAYRSGHPLNVELARTLSEKIPSGRTMQKMAA